MVVRPEWVHLCYAEGLVRAGQRSLRRHEIVPFTEDPPVPDVVPTPRKTDMSLFS